MFTTEQQTHLDFLFEHAMRGETWELKNTMMRNYFLQQDLYMTQNMLKDCMTKWGNVVGIYNK